MKCFAVRVPFAGPSLPWCPHSHFMYPCPPDTPSTPVVDITFVDDEAVIGMAGSPCTLTNQRSRAVFVVHSIFHDYHRHINFKTGKTEAMLAFRGHGAAARKAKLQDHIDASGEVCLPVALRDGGTANLYIVKMYRHLGFNVCIDGGLVPEAKA